LGPLASLPFRAFNGERILFAIATGGSFTTELPGSSDILYKTCSSFEEASRRVRSSTLPPKVLDGVGGPATASLAPSAEEPRSPDRLFLCGPTIDSDPPPGEIPLHFP